MSQVLASYAMEPPIFDDDNMEVVSDTAGPFDNHDDIDIDIDLVHEGAEQDNDVVVEDAPVTASDRLDMVDDTQELLRDADMADGEYQEHSNEHPQHKEAEYQFVDDTFDHEQQTFEMEEDYEEDIDAPIPGTSIIEPHVSSAKQAELPSAQPPAANKETEEIPVEGHPVYLESPSKESPSLKTEDVETVEDEINEPAVPHPPVPEDARDTNNIAEQEGEQPVHLQSPTEPRPDQQDRKVSSGDANEISDAPQNTTCETDETADELAALPDVKVLYQGSEISLFPPKEDDPSEIFFLEDEALAHEPISQLLDACRTVLADHITEEEEISVEIESLNLHLAESTAQYSSFSLSQIIQVYLDFAHNDDVTNPEPLYISISTRPTLDSTFHDLVEAARAGKGLSEIYEWEEQDDIPEKDEASETQHPEHRNESLEQEHIYDQGDDQGQVHQEEQAYNRDHEKDEGEQQEETYHQVEDQGQGEQREQLDTPDSAEVAPRDGHTITEISENAEQQPAEERQEGDGEHVYGVGSSTAQNDGNNSQQVTAPRSPNLVDNAADKEPSVGVLETPVPTEHEVNNDEENAGEIQIMTPGEAGSNFKDSDSTSVTIVDSIDGSASPTIVEAGQDTAADEAGAAAQSPVENAEEGIVQQNTDDGFYKEEDDIYEASIEVHPSQDEHEMVDGTYFASQHETTVADDTGSFEQSTDASAVYDQANNQKDTEVTVYDDENLEIDLSDSVTVVSNDEVTDNVNIGQEEEETLDEFADVGEHEYNLIDEDKDAAVDAQTSHKGTPEPANNLFEIDEGLFNSPEAKPQNPPVAIEDQQTSFSEGSRIPVVSSSRASTPEEGLIDEESYEYTGEESEVVDQSHNGYFFQEESPSLTKRPRVEDEPGALSESVPVTKRRRSEYE